MTPGAAEPPAAAAVPGPQKPAPTTSRAALSAADPGATIRSKGYRVLLVLAALVGVLVSFASWCFLELIHWIQEEVYRTLPSGLGFDAVAVVVAAAGDGGRRRAGGRRDHPPARPRRPHPL